MNCFSVMSDALYQIPVAPSKPKSRQLCSMHIFRGYEREWFIPRPEEGIPRPYGEVEMRDGQLFMQGPHGEYAVREVWRGCKGYCQRGLDICAVHATSRMRQQRKAATLIQSIARRNRAKKLVVALKNTFGQGQHRDVLMLILDEVRKGPATRPRKSQPEHQDRPLPVVRAKGSR